MIDHDHEWRAYVTRSGRIIVGVFETDDTTTVVGSEEDPAVAVGYSGVSPQNAERRAVCRAMGRALLVLFV